MAKKKSKSCDDLIDEIVDNARADREVIKGYLDNLQNLDKTNDPLVAMSLAENLAENLPHLVDSLTKANAQLVLAAGLKSKVEAKKSPTDKANGELSADEKENVFSTIEDNTDEIN
jgi:hypothetical protein